MEYIFSQFTQAECTEFSEWLKDVRVSKHIFIDDAKKYRLLADMHYRMYSVYKKSELIAHLSGEICKDDVSVCLIVKPELCGKGIGTAVLCEAVGKHRELFGDTETITAYIYEDNPASKRCFEKAGFVLSGKGNDGDNKYIYNIKYKRRKSAMNEVIEKMLERRSVRTYNDKMPADNVIVEIIKAGTYAASGMNRQETIIVAIKNKAIRDELARDNASVMGGANDPFYGAPVVLVVLYNKNCPTGIYDGSLVMGNLMLAAHSLGVSSCWIHRARETFEMPKWKDWLKTLGFDGEYVGVGNCILGYCDGEYPTDRGRKENRSIIVE